MLGLARKCNKQIVLFMVISSQSKKEQKKTPVEIAN